MLGGSSGSLCSEAIGTATVADMSGAPLTVCTADGTDPLEMRTSICLIASGRLDAGTLIDTSISAVSRFVTPSTSSPNNSTILSLGSQPVHIVSLRVIRSFVGRGWQTDRPAMASDCPGSIQERCQVHEDQASGSDMSSARSFFSVSRRATTSERELLLASFLISPCGPGALLRDLRAV